MSDELSIEQILGSIRQVILGKKNARNIDKEEDVYELTQSVELEDNLQNLASKTATNTQNQKDAQQENTQTKQLGASNALEDLMLELVKPYINKWLDENLPNIVKNLLEQKIKKLAESDEKNNKSF